MTATYTTVMPRRCWRAGMAAAVVAGEALRAVGICIGMARCRFSAPRFGSRVPNTLITLFTLVCIKVELKENAIILQNSRCYENEEEVGEEQLFFFLYGQLSKNAVF